MATAFTLTDGTFRSSRHTTHYWGARPVDGPLMIFLHGWPEIGLVWRAQVEAFASKGWHCIDQICAVMAVRLRRPPPRPMP